MRQFYSAYRGYEIYIWTTGKFEAWREGESSISGKNVNEVFDKIDQKLSKEN